MPQRARDTAAWSVLVYMCGDNDLESSAVADLREMKRVGSTDRVHVVVQFDRYHAGRPTRRYRLRKGTSLASDAVGPPLGETNTGDPNTLVDFARWAIDEYPAQRTLLVIWNHGQGWDDREVYARAERLGLRVVRRQLALDTGRRVTGPRLSTAAARRLADLGRHAVFPPQVSATLRASAIGFDDHARDFLDTLEVHRAVRRIRQHLGRPLEVLGFDACLMSMVEVLNGLEDGAQCAIASEEIIPLEGWAYDDMLRYLTATPDATPDALAVRIVRDYLKSYRRDRRVTLSACRLDSLEQLSTAVDGLCHALLPHRGDRGLRLALDDARRRAWRSSDTPEYVDLGTFCAALRARTRLAAVRARCADVVAVLRRRAVLASGHRGRPLVRPTGLTVYLPDTLPDRAMLRLYERLPFVRHTAWGRVVRAYSRGW